MINALLCTDDRIEAFIGSALHTVTIEPTGPTIDPTPIPADSAWPGLPFDQVDAAFVGKTGVAYLFCNDQYVRFDAATRELLDGARPVAEHWNVGHWHLLPKLWDVGYDDIAYWTGNGKAWFFRGEEYLRYDLSADRVDTSVQGEWVYPLDLTENWKLPFIYVDAFEVIDGGSLALASFQTSWALYDLSTHEVVSRGTWEPPDVVQPVTDRTDDEPIEHTGVEFNDVGLVEGVLLGDRPLAERSVYLAMSPGVKQAQPHLCLSAAMSSWAALVRPQLHASQHRIAATYGNPSHPIYPNIIDSATDGYRRLVKDFDVRVDEAATVRNLTPAMAASVLSSKGHFILIFAVKGMTDMSHALVVSGVSQEPGATPRLIFMDPWDGTVHSTTFARLQQQMTGFRVMYAARFGSPVVQPPWLDVTPTV